MVTPRQRILLIAAGAFVALGVLGIHAGPSSAGSLQSRLQVSAETALEEAGHAGWAELRLSGQVAYLSGLAPDEAARDEALAEVKSAAWAGGIVAGGITRVHDDIRLAGMPQGAVLSADVSAGRLVLTGFAPDAESRDQIAFTAERLFAGRADVSLRLAPGAAPVGWEAAVRLLLGEVARVETGSARLRGDRMTLFGQAANAQTARSITAEFSRAPGVFQTAALVRQAGSRYSAIIEDGPLCALMAEAALGEHRTGFDAETGAVAPGSRAALARAAAALGQCRGDYAIGVQAPAQAGEDAAARSEAVMAALIEAGVAPDRLRVAAADSAGEARPVFTVFEGAALSEDTPLSENSGEAAPSEDAAGDDEAAEP
ncbi:MAG: hypothetical protein AAFX09_13685 [Pseudomonadota bacterium]